MHLKAKLKMPTTKELLMTTGLSESGAVQKHIDKFVLNHCEPYLPKNQEGHIYDSGTTGTKIGSGEVIWNSPDANYLYEGKLMVDSITLKGAFFNPNFGYWSRPGVQKIMDPKGRDLHYNEEPKRGKKWFDRMIENEMDDLVEEVQHIINGDE